MNEHETQARAPRRSLVTGPVATFAPRALPTTSSRRRADAAAPVGDTFDAIVTDEKDDKKHDASAPPVEDSRFKTATLIESESFGDALNAKLKETLSPSLVILAGPDVGVRLRLDESIEVGRDPAVKLPLRDANISWRHLRIEDRGAGEWAVVDLGSTNGTRVNDARVPEAVLQPGDRIFLGKTVLEFQVHDALREKFTQEVQRLLHHDELTGLWVRRRFDAQLETAVAAVHAGKLPVVTVMVMDLDGVKQINDTHGHHYGAYTIATAGKILGACIGERGFATRFGGDEYAAAFPGMSKDDAMVFGETLRVAVTSHVYERAGVQVKPGMSVGIASVPGDAPTAEEAFRAADQAMYRAKRGGKNRVST